MEQRAAAVSAKNTRVALSLVALAGLTAWVPSWLERLKREKHRMVVRDSEHEGGDVIEKYGE